MKIHPVGAELFHATDGRTDMTKLIDAFGNFANTPKNLLSPKQHYSVQGPPTFLAKGRNLFY
jgi:hypothetical protein